MATWGDFDRYLEEHGIPADYHPAAFALWYAETTGEPVRAWLVPSDSKRR